MRTITFSLLYVLQFSFLLQARVSHNIHKICVPETAKNVCLQMVSEGLKQNVQMACITGRDRLDCLEKVHQHNADFSFVEPEDMYIASNIANKGFFILKEIRNKDESEAEFRYKGVAVVRNEMNIKSISSLKGLKSCHTGIGRSVGYKIPITKLTKMKVIGPLSDTSISPRENELKALSSLFSKACIVGRWAPDEATNQRLKSQYSNLCALCEHPDICDYPDENSGYEGSLRCLTKGGGDVAWTKTMYVDQYFGLKGSKLNDPDDYAYLCPDGKKVPLGQTPCTWAARPWSGYIADAKLNDTSALRDEISKLNKLGEALSSEWFTIVLQLNNKSITVDSANMLHPYEYLSKSKFYDVIGRNVVTPRRSIRWCVTTDVAQQKCKNLKIAAFSRDIRPEFDCVLESSIEKCLRMIRDGGADIITLDATDAIMGINKYNAKAIAVEKYYKNITELYALAVVRSNSTFESLEDLRGKRSCHSLDMKSAGWIAPVYTLLKNELIDKEKCDYSDSLAEFFSGGVCLPFFSDKNEGFTKLTNNCGKKSSSGYEEYQGPMKCLTSNQGDVAFVMHVNVMKSIDENKTLENDIQLLCSDGSKAPFNSYQDCNLGKIAPKLIITNNQKTDVELDEVRNALLEISNLYGSKPELFKLFGRYKKSNNVLFSNTAVGLKLIDDVSSQINTQFKNMLEIVSYCENKKSSENSKNYIVEV